MNTLILALILGAFAVMFIAPLLGGMLTKIIDAPINRRLRKNEALSRNLIIWAM
jgi:hypothetical protein